MVTLQQIKEWFRTGLRPTQQQFWDSFDSFWSVITKVEENSKTGIRLQEEPPANHGNIGNKAIDLSISKSLSDDNGATGDYSFATGLNTAAKGKGSFVEGFNNEAIGNYSHAEGGSRLPAGSGSEDGEGGESGEGDTSSTVYVGNKAGGEGSHAEGVDTRTGNFTGSKPNDIYVDNGFAAHAEGYATFAEGDYAHAEGKGTMALGDGSHAEGSYTRAQGKNAHAEGMGCNASGENSHAEGVVCIASGRNAHAQNRKTEARGCCSHAEGLSTLAKSNFSHAGGLHAITHYDGSQAIGISYRENSSVEDGRVPVQSETLFQYITRGRSFQPQLNFGWLRDGMAIIKSDILLARSDGAFYHYKAECLITQSAATGISIIKKTISVGKGQQPIPVLHVEGTEQGSLDFYFDNLGGSNQHRYSGYAKVEIFNIPKYQ